MNKIYSFLIIAFSALTLTNCQGDGEVYIDDPSNWMSSPTVNYYNGDVKTNSLILRDLYDYISVADNAYMEDAITLATNGASVMTINKLRPNTQYYLMNSRKDDFGGLINSPANWLTTKDYDSKMKMLSNTQVLIDMGSVEYDKFIIADNSYMNGAVAIDSVDMHEHSSGCKEIWDTRPNTTYYWATEATDLWGKTYRSPVQQFTTYDWNMYMEDIGRYTATFNAGEVYYDYFYLSDVPNMSNIVRTYKSDQKTIMSGLTDNTTYYYQIAATDLFGKVYRSPIYSFKTLAYDVVTMEPKVTSATAHFEAKIDGSTAGHVYQMVFEVRENGGGYFGSFDGIYDPSSDTYYADIAVMDNSNTYSVKAYTRENGSSYSEGVTRDFVLDSHHPAEAVDMGLSVKWATYNVGARYTWEYGGLYYYGDTQAWNYVGRYIDQYDISGTYRDIARKAWGGSWRMPTEAEFNELRNNCTIVSMTQLDVPGYLLISTKNYNYIFIPAAGRRPNSSWKPEGRGSYAEIYTGSAPTNYRLVEDENGTHYGKFQASYYYIIDTYMYYGVGINDYQIGRSIRPVCP